MSDALEPFISQRAPITRWYRSSYHAAAGVLAYSRTKQKRWLILGVGSVAVDLYRAHRMRDINYVPGNGSILVDAVDGVAWTMAATSDPITSRGTFLHAVVPAAIEAGFRFGYGTDVVPQVAGVHSYPPVVNSPRDWIAPISRLCTPWIVPCAAIVLTRRARGMNSAVAHSSWGVMGALSTFGMVRQRAHEQRSIRATWEHRVADQIDVEEHAARIRAATTNGVGHDFKKTLAVLGSTGSADAANAARAQAAHPGQVMSQSLQGLTLRDAAGWIWIEPPDAASRWISQEQGESLRAFMFDTEERVDTVEKSELIVVAESLDVVRIEYLGATFEVRHARPPIRFQVDPIPQAFFVGAAVKTASLLVGEFDTVRARTLFAVVLDIVGGIWYWRHPPDEHTLRSIAPVAISSAIFCYAIARGETKRVTPHGTQVFAASSGIQSLILVAERYKGDLAASAWILRAAALALWCSELFPNGRPLADVFAQLVPLACQGGALHGLAARIRFESETLEASLAETFRDTIAHLRLDSADDEIRRFWEQLTIADIALAKTSDIPAEIRSALTQECEALRLWLNDPTTRTKLAGLS